MSAPRDIKVRWRRRSGTTVGGVTPPPPAPSIGVPAYITPTPTSASLSSGSPTQTIASQVFDAGNVLLGNTLFYTSSNTAVATVTQAGVITRVAAGSCTITVSTIPPITGVNGAIGTTSSLPYNTAGVLAMTTLDHAGTGSWNVADSIVSDPSGLLGGNVVRQVYATTGPGDDDNHDIYVNYPTGVPMGASFFMRGDLVVSSTDAPNDGTSFAKLFYPKFARYLNNGWINGGENTNVGNAMALARRGQPGTFDAESNHVPSDGVAHEYDFGSAATCAVSTKYRIKFQVRVNSTFESYDGFLKLWINGLLVLNRQGLSFTDPLYATTRTPWSATTSYGTAALVYYAGQVWCNMLDSGVSGANLNHTPGLDSTWLVPDPTKARFGEFAIGQQLQGLAALNEVRLWKNLIVSLQDPGDADPTGGEV